MYKRGLKEGYGVFTWPDGRVHDGYWQEGKKHGQGTAIEKGVKRKGYWDKGEHKKWVTEFY